MAGGVIGIRQLLQIRNDYAGHISPELDTGGGIETVQHAIVSAHVHDLGPARLGALEAGVIVLGVTEGGRADKGGLRFDRITQHRLAQAIDPLIGDIGRAVFIAGLAAQEIDQVGGGCIGYLRGAE